MKHLGKILGGLLLAASLGLSEAETAGVTYTWDYVQDSKRVAVEFRLFTQLDCTGTTTTKSVPVKQSTGSFSQSFNELSLLPGRKYCTTVAAVDSAGIVGDRSDPVTFQVQEAEVKIPRPTNLRVTTP